VAKQIEIPITVTSKQLATFLRVTPRTISNWTREGHLKQRAGGVYDFYDAVLSWAQRDHGSTRKEIEAAKAEKIKRENAVAANKLVPLDRYHADIVRIVSALRMWLKALPGRVASSGAMKDPASLREIVRVECARVIEEISDAADNGFAAVTYGASAADAETDTVN